MKKLNRIISLILSLTTVFSTMALSACKKQSGPTGNVFDTQIHAYTDTLHKVNVSTTGVPFVNSAVSDYKVVVDTSNYYRETAANFIINHIKKATGAKLGLVAPKDVTWSANGKYIVIGDKDLFQSAGLEMPQDDIGLVGYYIKTIGNSVFIMTNGNDGYQLGAIAFLRAVLGYDMFSDDCVIYEKDGSVLPEMDIVERPDYDYRQNPNKLRADTVYGMGFTSDTEIWIPVRGSTIHNAFEWLPPKMYKEDHPGWYAQDDEQLCYTAHGDPEEYEAMVQAAFETAKTSIENATNQNAKNISFTIEDHPTCCECEECNKNVAKYGCISATTIHFLNDLDDRLQAWLEEDALIKGTEKKEINIVFFAYYATETPPVIKDSKGNFQPVDETVVCNDHVGVYIAPIHAKYNVSFYDPENSSYADNIRGWSVCSKLVYLWLYQTNFNNYLFPMNNWDVITETYRFGKHYNAVFMYDEGQLNQFTTTAFTRLKDYICSKVEFDLNVDLESVIAKYFKYYYRDAGVYMREFFDEMQAYVRYIEAEFPNKFTGGIFDSIALPEYWKKGTLDGWMDKINASLSAIEKYKTADKETYDMLVRHIKIESIFPRFALCTLYEGMFDADTLKEMRVSLRDDCLAVELERSAEYTMMNTSFTLWGL